MISKKKNILLLHSSNDLYGASKIFLQLIDLFITRDFNVHVVLPEKGKLDSFLIEKNIKIEYYELGVLRKKYLNPLGLINRLFSNINAIKFLSNYIKNHWLKNIDEYKIERVYNGIVFKKIDSLIKLDSDQDDFVITSVARLIPYKGHCYFIDIANELIKKSIKFKFLIVGDSLSSYLSYEKSVKQKVKGLGLENQIKFLGFRNDVSSILKQSDLFIHPAIAPDPLPTVLFESLYNDLPTVATNLGGAIEILDNGNNGLLIPYNDPKKAANLINEYCSNNKLQKKHLENSKKNFKINFSSESFNKNILKEVNSLL